MQSKQPNARVSLGGAIVQCDDGTTVVVPWTDVGSGGYSTFSARMRALHPSLPAKLSFGAEVGSDIRTRLRVRSFARAFQKNQVNEYILMGAPADLVGTGTTIAISSAILAVAFEVGLRAAATSSMPGVAVEFDARLLAHIDFIRLVLGTCMTVLPIVLIFAGLWRNRTPRVLAVHATSDGVTLRRHDGRSDYRRWKSIVCAEQRGRVDFLWRARFVVSREPWENAFCRTQARVIRRAAQRAFIKPTKRVPVEKRMRAALLKSMSFGVAAAAFWITVTALAILFPGEPRPGKKPPSPEFVLAVGGLLALLNLALPALLTFECFGWHRSRLRWQQMWRIPRSKRNLTANGAWPIP